MKEKIIYNSEGILIIEILNQEEYILTTINKNLNPDREIKVLGVLKLLELLKDRFIVMPYLKERKTKYWSIKAELSKV